MAVRRRLRRSGGALCGQKRDRPVQKDRHTNSPSPRLFRNPRSLIKGHRYSRHPDNGPVGADVFRFQPDSFCRGFVSPNGRHAKRAAEKSRNRGQTHRRELSGDDVRGLDGGNHRFLLDRVATCGPWSGSLIALSSLIMARKRHTGGAMMRKNSYDQQLLRSVLIPN